MQRRPAESGARGRRIRAGEIELAYDDAGGGMPLVLIHGFPHHRALWEPQLRGLSSRCRCLTPDLRGFGESEVCPPFTIDQYADDMAHLLDALGIERAVIGGLSMGGYIAFAFWRRHRGRVLALILADTRGTPDTEEGRAKRRDLIASARARGSVAVADAMIAGMVGATTRERQPAVVAAVHAMLAGAPLEGVIGALEALAGRADSIPTLATIDVPTLIVVGEEDALTPPADSERLHAGIAGSILEIIPKAGHVSNVERPAAFNHLVGEFLERVSAMSGAAGHTVR